VAAAASKVGWKVVDKVFAAAAGVVAAKGTGWAYRKVRKTAPPTQPGHPDTTLAEAVGWAVLSAVALEVVRVLARRTAARGWERATGSLPPGMEHAETPELTAG
jgi:Protein of unknown function (DUF4235)